MQGYFSAPESYSDFFGVFSKNIYRKAVWVTVDIQISKWVIWCWKMLLKCHFPQLHEKLFVHWAKLLFISSIQNVNNILTGQILTISAVSKRSVWKNVRGSLWNGRSFMVEKLINSSSYKLHTSQWRSNDAERGIREINSRWSCYWARTHLLFALNDELCVWKIKPVSFAWIL